MEKKNQILIICGDYGITHSFCKIFDRIWMNAIGGHSFGVVNREKYNGEKTEKNLGGFDGDGWANVDYQIHLENGDVFESGDWKDASLNVIDKKGNGKGDCLLIVKGSRDGIESLRDIFNNALNELDKEDKEYGSIRLYSDDDADIDLGSAYNDSDSGGSGFGFYVVLEDNKVFDNPLEFARKLGMEVNFFRR